jgi:hypothetical protein
MTADDEDKEVARISDLAMMHVLMKRAYGAEADLERVIEALERIAEGSSNGPRCHAIAQTALRRIGRE